jgi:predicted nucleic acid-binding protein
VTAYFVDSSALVKRYVSEHGTETVQRLLRPPAAVYVAHITGAEVVAAISRCARRGDIDRAAAALALGAFRMEFREEFVVLPTNTLVIDRAMDLAERHVLRGYDAVQLATALEATARLLSYGFPAPSLVSADAGLNNAAEAEGLLVLNPAS